MAAAARSRGEPLAWFEKLYADADAGRATVPWADLVPNPHLVSWTPLQQIEPGRALVVGCGYGDDAEWLAGRGWDVTAFDISPAAVAACRRRFPDTAVDYVAADLTSPPEQWKPFDLVVEIYTLQVLPPGSPERSAAAAALRALTGGDLLVIARARAEDEPEGEMPWPLTESEVRAIAGDGLDLSSLEDFPDDEEPPVRRFRAHFHRSERRPIGGPVLYDRIGAGYARQRRADPRIAEAINEALGDARTVVNVGAGTGSYEPTDRQVVPIEPSTTMAAQRPGTLPPAVLASAESLPLTDGSADAAMAVLTVHHWSDWRRGIAEMQRVAGRVVVLTIDPDVQARMWLFADYVPEIAAHDAEIFPGITEILDALGDGSMVRTIPVPHDCRDGFALAWWARPETVLDPRARAATSGFRWLDDDVEAAAVARLGEDLRTGVWDERYGDLRRLDEFDAGLRLVVSDGRA